MVKKFVYYGFSIIIGFLFYVIISLGNNAKLLPESSLINWTIIFGLVISFYILIVRSIQNIIHLYLGGIGFLLAKLSIPFLIILFKIIIVNNQSENKVIQIKDDKKLKINKCKNNKYGCFFNGEDTLVRFEKDNRNFEEIRTLNGIQKIEIMWIDPCSYVRINEESRIGKELVKIININDSISKMIVTPIDSRSVVNERIFIYEKLNSVLRSPAPSGSPAPDGNFKRQQVK